MDPLRLGFTGTREGLTAPQIDALCATFDAFKGRLVELHHGDCLGADALAHGFAKDRCWRIVTHPCIGHIELRAFMPGAGETREPRQPLDRNQDIVEETDILVACPKTMAEEIRSGTWATVRRARRKRRPIAIIWPDGSTRREGTLRQRKCAGARLNLG